MTALNLIPKDAVVIHDADIRTTSLKVAEAFGRLHKNVIQKIESLDCSAEFASANFSAHVSKVQAGAVKRNSKYYEMTKDGFMFLVMGFTGKQAAQIKEAYINAFNAMAATLAAAASTTTTDDRTGLRNAVNLLVSKRSLMYSDAYSLIHQRFNVNQLDDLKREQLPQAVEYVHRLILEGDLIRQDDPAIPMFESREQAIQAWQSFKHLSKNVEYAKKMFEELGLMQFLKTIDSGPARILLANITVANNIASEIDSLFNGAIGSVAK
jgi:Rha family phage regulatory protein